MKLKILFVPSAIVAAIILVIWGIVPAYGNYKQAKDTLKADQAKLQDVDGKEKNIQSLSDQLKASADQQGVLMEYIPSSEQEEDVIGSLNDLASSENLTVGALSMATDNAGSAYANNNTAKNQNKDQADSFEVKMDVAGQYQNIKNFLEKLVTLKRYNEIAGLTISGSAAANTPDNQGNQKQAPSDVLAADVTMGFNYLKTANSVDDFNGSIFATGKFNMDAIKDIQAKTSTDMSKIQDNSSGRANPFLP